MRVSSFLCAREEDKKYSGADVGGCFSPTYTDVSSGVFSFSMSLVLFRRSSNPDLFENDHSLEKEREKKREGALTVGSEGVLVLLHNAALVDEPLQLGRHAGLLRDLLLEREDRSLGVHLGQRQPEKTSARGMDCSHPGL